MIKELSANKNKYFWSKSFDGNIIIGGYNNGLFYGQIVLAMDENTAPVQADESNGATSSISQADKTYSKLTQEYRIIETLFTEMDEYLEMQDTKFNQELMRETLMKNVMNLLPDYSNLIQK